MRECLKFRLFHFRKKCLFVCLCICIHKISSEPLWYMHAVKLNYVILFSSTPNTTTYISQQNRNFKTFPPTQNNKRKINEKKKCLSINLLVLFKSKNKSLVPRSYSPSLVRITIRIGIGRLLAVHIGQFSKPRSEARQIFELQIAVVRTRC